MKLALFVSLLVVLTAQAQASCSCVGKTVEVFVANGQDLTGDGVEYPDPYVLVSIGAGTYRTRTIVKDSNPVWKETIIFRGVTSDLLNIEVWEEDAGPFRGGDDHLGTCMEALKQDQGFNGDAYSTVECTVVHGGRVKVFYKCY